METTEGVYDTFTALCVVCGGTVEYESGHRKPHRCRIDLDAQKGLTDGTA